MSFLNPGLKIFQKSEIVSHCFHNKESKNTLNSLIDVKAVLWLAV